jgi:anti-sigma regulatory factor (Ser/Thr protein kinase)
MNQESGTATHQPFAHTAPLSLSPLFPTTRHGAHTARHTAEQWLAKHLPPPTGDLATTATLLVAELTANATPHGRVRGRRARLDFRLSPTEPLIEVTDARGDRPPTAQHPEDGGGSGRGLLLIESLSDDWGVRPPPVVFSAVLQEGRWPPGPAWLFPPVEGMTWGWCHRVREAPLETLMRGPTTARSGAMPGSTGAAGLHNVDARTTPTPRPAPHTPVREDGVNDNDGIGVFLGLDVGKTNRHGHGLTPAGKKVFDKQLPNTEPKLRDVCEKLKAKFGTVLVIVDQPASIGALPLTVARDAGCKVAYCRVCRCGGSPISTQARPKPTPATRP